MKNIVEAILNVMADVKNIEKNMNVGDGRYSYKGVADKDVKQAIGDAMRTHGLVIIPVSIEPTTKIDRWTEGERTKQSIFVEVITKYRLLHTSGESIEIMGYGHGVDSQDKASGKATTYALKYALLYTFMVATGNIDDADTTHSDTLATPKKTTATPSDKSDDEKEWLSHTYKDGNLTKAYLNVLEGMKKGTVNSVADVRKVYRVSKEVAVVLEQDLAIQKELNGQS
jgi:hypothetical protein